VTNSQLFAFVILPVIVMILGGIYGWAAKKFIP
jgi:hypothetical protein